MSDTEFRMPHSYFEPPVEVWVDCPDCENGVYVRGRDEFGVWDTETCSRCQGTCEIEKSEL